MVTKTMLQQITFLKNQPDHILQKVGEIAQIEEFAADHILYRQDEIQDVFYMLLNGKVLLNSNSPKGLTMTLDVVLPGRVFGVPALLNDSCGAFTAVCAEPSKLITLNGKQMREMFEADFEMGHILMRKLVEMYKLRRDMHTKQFLQSLKSHSEIQQLQI